MIKYLEARLASKFDKTAAFMMMMIAGCVLIGSFCLMILTNAITPFVGEHVVRILFWGGSLMLVPTFVGTYAVSVFGGQNRRYQRWLTAPCAFCVGSAIVFLGPGWVGVVPALACTVAVSLTCWAWHLIYVFDTVGTEHAVRLSWKRIGLLLAFVAAMIYFWVPEGAVICIIQHTTPGHPEFVELALWSARFALVTLGAFYVWCVRHPLVEESSDASAELTTP